jgi:hypothetical protein
VLRELQVDPSVVADATTCVLQYQELDLNVVAARLRGCSSLRLTTTPFKRAKTDWLFKLSNAPWMYIGLRCYRFESSTVTGGKL